VRLFLLARHGQSLLNVDGVVNGDPARDPGLSEEGRREALRLGQQLSAVRVELVAVSPFPRAMQTAQLALEGREVAQLVDDDLGDVRLGELEGATLLAYRRAEAHNDHRLRFPGGESLNEAAHRYARALARLLARSEPVTLVVCHEIPVRYAVNAAAESHDLNRPVHDIANATVYVFDEAGLQQAITSMDELSR
jgi:broad specificity phosphatase PhoE